MNTLGIPFPSSKEKIIQLKDEAGNLIKDENGEIKTKKKMVPYDKDGMIESCMAWLYCPKAVKPKQVKPDPSKNKKRPSSASLKSSSSDNQPKSKISKISLSTSSSTSLDSLNILSQTNPESSPKPPAKPRPPKPSQLKAYIHRILKKANLEEVTMKNVCNQVYDRWPEFREKMVARKGEIKGIVKEYIANT